MSHRHTISWHCVEGRAGCLLQKLGGDHCGCGFVEKYHAGSTPPAGIVHTELEKKECYNLYEV